MELDDSLTAPELTFLVDSTQHHRSRSLRLIGYLETLQVRYYKTSDRFEVMDPPLPAGTHGYINIWSTPLDPTADLTLNCRQGNTGNGLRPHSAVKFFHFRLDLVSRDSSLLRN
ncbi:hypothetical protein J6590_094910 [Homalodisca vitripennis]|nr:hypothetical protein J6590_067916 [Homalodisca vitripennis]KAG8324329.1 hypothetical protein J6590_094910 [Homalodisca vitripennis]